MLFTKIYVAKEKVFWGSYRGSRLLEALHESRIWIRDFPCQRYDPPSQTMLLDLLATHRLPTTCPVLRTRLHLSRSGGGPRGDHADYSTDGEDGDDEPSDDDDDDDTYDDDDDDDTDDEEEEPLRPRSTQIRVGPFCPGHGLRMARRMTVRLKPPMSLLWGTPLMCIAAVPKPPLPIASLPLPLPSPLTTSPTNTGAPLTIIDYEDDEQGASRSDLLARNLAFGEVGKSVGYGVSKELDTAYWRFLRVGTTLDIFQNIILIPYLGYGVLSFSGYGILMFILLWSLVSAGTDTPYLP
ncbi:hypothetical protein Tco_0573224 [Tanacetum coccineum]